MRWLVDLRERIDRALTPKRIVIFGWLWSLVYGFPGYMSYDSVWQLAQARNIDKMNEWHPPVMAFIWSITDFFIAGPIGMLLVQTAAFVFGLYGVLRHAMTPRTAALLTVLVMWLPQNICVMGVVWKDSQMAGYLLASMACLLSGGRWGKLGGAFFLFLATGVRYNAAAATLPIMLWLWDRREEVSRPRRIVVGVGWWLAITIAAVVFSATLVEERKYPWHTGAAPVDILGTMRFSGKMTDEHVLEQTAGVPWLYKDKLWRRSRTIYSPYNSYLEITQYPAPVMDYISTPEHRAAITRAWKNIVLRHPIAFARHRIGVFDAQLDMKAYVWYAFANAPWGEDLVKHTAWYGKLQLKWVRVVQKLAPTPLGHVRIYFWVLILLLPICWGERLTRVMVVSGILHELGLFLIAPAIDYRYSHWMVVATIMAIILAITSRIKRPPESASAALVPDAP